MENVLIKTNASRKTLRLHNVGAKPSDIITAKTIKPNERLTALSHNVGVDHADSSEPLPEFSRDIGRGYRRFEAARIKATIAGEKKEESSE